MPPHVNILLQGLQQDSPVCTQIHKTAQVPKRYNFAEFLANIYMAILATETV